MSPVTRAEWALAEFKGTSVEASPRWRDLAGKVAGIRRKVNVHNAPDQEAIQKALRLLEAEKRKGGLQ